MLVTSVRFILHQPVTGNKWQGDLSPNQFALLEAFRDGQAGVEHVQSEHFKAAVRDIPALVVKTPDIVNVEVPGTEWSKLVEMAVPEGSSGS